MSDRFVATDAGGRQHYEGFFKTWPLPVRKGDEWEPGGVVEPDENGAPVTLDAAELLETLGECVFVAELVGDAGAARLVKGTAWSEKLAAAFALDCVEHLLRAVPGSAEAELPGGATLGAIISSAREFLATGTGSDGARLGLVSRIAAARRLRREGAAIGDAAFAAAAQDEGADVDLLDDPAWATLAAARDAVLAAIEAVRHVAFPFLVDRETRRYEAREEGAAINVDEVDTPWGAFPVGGGGPRYAPSWAAARDAAEHSRRAAVDLSGPSKGDAEGSWQGRRLAELLSAE